MRNKSKLKRLYMNPTSPCSLAHLHSLTLVSSICSPPEQHRGTRNGSYIRFITHCLCSSFLTLFSWPRVGSLWHGLFPQAAVLQGKSICLSVVVLHTLQSRCVLTWLSMGCRGTNWSYSWSLWNLWCSECLFSLLLPLPLCLKDCFSPSFLTYFFQQLIPTQLFAHSSQVGWGTELEHLKGKKTCGLR